MAEVKDNSSIQLFEDQKIRTAWDAEKEEWYFAIVDVISVLTDSANPQIYWRVLKKRLKDEGNETVTNCNALKLTAPDGKQYFYFGTLCPEVGKTGERYQPLPGRVRALPARRAVSRDQTAAPIRRHSLAVRSQVLRDKLRRKCWLELPLGSDCWSIAAGVKPAHEPAKG